MASHGPTGLRGAGGTHQTLQLPTPPGSEPAALVHNQTLQLARLRQTPRRPLRRISRRQSPEGTRLESCGTATAAPRRRTRARGAEPPRSRRRCPREQAPRLCQASRKTQSVNPEIARSTSQHPGGARERRERLHARLQEHEDGPSAAHITEALAGRLIEPAPRRLHVC